MRVERVFGQSPEELDDFKKRYPHLVRKHGSVTYHGTTGSRTYDV